ncbi:hypothetical protein POVWA2_027560 [Plasmodium ovale wallikeri]|uniref:Uncharacterized protein n=1 Tax=Plasmodium ovale wallikeri TaxID=864142 RepID=A0A1A8YVH2_PLAOA|nr:hypothetical protein POVWA1_027390 [Plasmodium ovale wallikeri]SBT35944.1 hypothetical protein POVWA2_027560 [Plasmodium ovale wallikeri]
MPRFVVPRFALPLFILSSTPSSHNFGTFQKRNCYCATLCKHVTNGSQTREGSPPPPLRTQISVYAESFP